jgi:CubicO group peptidase (beta-lactamase class C family)
MTKRLAVLCLGAACAAAPAAAQQSAAPSNAAAIEAIVAAPIKAGKVAGASVVVAERGQTIIAKSFGMADLELDVPMPDDASFEIGSVTKQFTAASILLLTERGKLALDDEVTKYLPDYPTHGQRITIRHLLTHTSGIKGYTEMKEFGDIMPLRKPADTLVKMFGARPLDFAPGEAMVYNNSAYFLLGLIIEKLSGGSYADFVKTNIFDKVGMKNSYYCSESEVHHHHAHGYDTAGDTLVLKGAISHAWPFAAGSLCSTAADLTAWLGALHGGKLLSADSYRAMTTPATLNDGTKLRYGFGLALVSPHGHRSIAHGGGINGFLSEAAYYPENGLSIVLLLNTAGPVNPSRLGADIADVILGKVPETTATYPGDLTPFAGTYEGVGRGRPTIVTIAVDHGTLTMTGAAPAAQVLAYRGGETFGVNETRLTFEREGGRVVRLRFDAGSGYYPLKRKAPASH